MTFVIKSVRDLALPMDFDCTESALNKFLLEHALENEKRGLSSTHFFCRQEEGNSVPEILGYFSVATTVLDVAQLPTKLTKRYPKYVKENLTVTLLARLGLDKKYHKQGLGSALLIAALKTAVDGWGYINSIGLLVHAKHQAAAEFYEKYGFSKIEQNPLHFFMPRASVMNIVQQAANSKR